MVQVSTLNFNNQTDYISAIAGNDENSPKVASAKKNVYFRTSVYSQQRNTAMSKLSYSDRKKLGNAVVYIAQHIDGLSKTKLLKLLYFMEEYSVRRFQTPFLGLSFEVWQAGPVAKDVFVDLSETPVLLDGYVKRTEADGKTYIIAEKDFTDDEFSDNDITVMDDILKKYGTMTATELVKLTHKEGTLWRKTAERNGLLTAFEQKLMNNSDCTIDFSEELSGCGKEFYKEQLDFLQMSRAYGTDSFFEEGRILYFTPFLFNDGSEPKP